MFYENLSVMDREVTEALLQELNRQNDNIELIASENFVPESIMEAMGSAFTNKYAEGYPGKRYYGGCHNVDIVESLAIERAKSLFGADHANVQPHSGTQANMGVYFSVCQPGDTVLGMNLSHGGHLSHGHPLNFSGLFYKIVPYGVSKETETIDYDEMERLALEHRPKMIIAGASAYPRTIDFRRIRQIADKVGAVMTVDMAHIAGLVAAGVHPSPVPFADFVTSTTHKTLRGPRGGFILCREPFKKNLNKNVFPGMQGGPLMHVIAAKALCFKMAMTEEFKAYQKQVVANAKVLAGALQDNGFRIVSGGTDNHLMLVDLTSKGVSGKDVEIALDKAHITVNKNTIPFDPNPPLVTSGIRLGTPAVTTRGMKEEEMKTIAALIAEAVHNIKDDALLEKVAGKVRDLTKGFPLYPNLREKYQKDLHS